jgi:threonine/homoserine/homoserine lactone efflux protein
MGQGISEVLPFAIGVAISPIPIIAVILILFSNRAKVNGPVFLLGWIIGLAVIVAVVYGIAHAANADSDSTSSDTVSWLKVGLGVVLLGAARRQFAKRPKPGEAAQMPKWMNTVDDMKPGAAFVLALVCSAVNPKNLILAAGAAAGVAQIPGNSVGDSIVALLVFVVIASLSVGGAVAYYSFGGEKARAHLDDLKVWLSTNNAAVMTTLLLIIGVVLIAKGLDLLTL